MLGVSDIVNCMYVCKRFYTIGKNNLLWKQLFKVKFYNVRINENDFWNNYKKYSILNNFLLKNKLSFDDIKTRLLGHWGTCPGINYTYAC